MSALNPIGSTNTMRTRAAPRPGTGLYVVLTRRQARRCAADGELASVGSHWFIDLLFITSVCLVLAVGLLGEGAQGHQPLAADDPMIARAVNRAIERDLGLAVVQQINVISEDATVTLEGVVRTPLTRVRAAVDAGNVFGVRRVVNRLKIR